jgi:hypothetical protein
MRLALPALSRRRLVHFLVGASLALNVVLVLAYAVQTRILRDALDGLDRWTVLGRVLLVTTQHADHESGALRGQLQACRVAQIKEYLATELSAPRAPSAERETTRPRQPRDGRH